MCYTNPRQPGPGTFISAASLTQLGISVHSNIRFKKGWSTTNSTVSRGKVGGISLHMAVKAHEEILFELRRSDVVNTRIRNRPVEGNSMESVILRDKRKKGRRGGTILEVSQVRVCIPSHDGIEQSTSRLQSSLKVLVAGNRIRSFQSRILDKHSLPVLNSAATSETTTIAENLEELLVSQALYRAIRADLPRKHRGKFSVNSMMMCAISKRSASYEAAEDAVLLFLGTQTVDCVGQLPREVIRIHHGDVHALPCLRAMCMASFARIS